MLLARLTCRCAKIPHLGSSADAVCRGGRRGALARRHRLIRQSNEQMKSKFSGTDRVLKPRASDSKLLAIALSGFVSITGCGDDEGAAVASAADAGPGDAGEATDVVTDGSDAGETSSRETSSVVFGNDAGDETSVETSLVPATDAGGETSAALSSSASPRDAGGSSLESTLELDGGSATADAAEPDRDEDGFSEADGDCDDFNNTIHPGALEIGADGFDSNCDGEDGSEMTLIWSSSDEGEDLVDALSLIDTDEDGEISLEEFADACAESAQLVGEGQPGFVQYHASCAGNNGCRGMVLQSWGELYEHSCRGSNFCAGWSCVQGAADAGRDAAASFDAGHCGYCHSGADGSFGIPVHPGEDLTTYLDQFWDKRSDEYLRSLIAFGANYISPDGFAVANMPAAYKTLSRAEIDRLITLLRSLPVSGHQFDLPGLPAPSEPSEGDAGAETDGMMMTGGDAG